MVTRSNNYELGLGEEIKQEILDKIAKSKDKIEEEPEFVLDKFQRGRGSRVRDVIETLCNNTKAVK